MDNSFGNFLKIKIYGSSHSKYLKATIKNFPKDIKINMDEINHFLYLRKSHSKLTTSRFEDDEVIFESGINNNITTGETISFKIYNKNTKSSDYVKGVCRPSHADYVGYLKYGDNYDYKGGGFFSGRLSVLLVVIGALCKQVLNSLNVKVASHIKELHGILDDDFNFNKLNETINKLNKKEFAVINNNTALKMKKETLKAKDDNDSVGGIIETIAINVPICLGEPYFNSFESYLSHLLFSLGGIKGVEFGDGFAFKDKKGSEVVDELKIINNNVKILSNHNGGINGGISNGNPIIFRCVVKPTSSISKTLNTINYLTNENITLNLKGRHDPCILTRIRVVIDAITYITILDFYLRLLKKG